MQLTNVNLLHPHTIQWILATSLYSSDLTRNLKNQISTTIITRLSILLIIRIHETSH